jgi:flagellar biosynthetic protein FliQ
MNTDFALALTQETLWTALRVSAPVLIATTVTGVVVSIFQVVTQIQEASLAFVPKMVAAVLSISIFGAWMLTTITAFARELIRNIPLY